MGRSKGEAGLSPALSRNCMLVLNSGKPIVLNAKPVSQAARPDWVRHTSRKGWGHDLDDDRLDRKPAPALQQGRLI
jgi:hypothetical protein